MLFRSVSSLKSATPPKTALWRALLYLAYYRILKKEWQGVIFKVVEFIHDGSLPATFWIIDYLHSVNAEFGEAHIYLNLRDIEKLHWVFFISYRTGKADVARIYVVVYGQLLDFCFCAVDMKKEDIERKIKQAKE